MKKLYNNVDNIKNSQNNAINDLKYKEMESKIKELESNIINERKEKMRFEDELKNLKLEFTKSNSEIQLRTIDEEKQIKQLVNHLNNFENKFVNVVKKYEESENKTEEQKLLNER